MKKSIKHSLAGQASQQKQKQDPNYKEKQRKKALDYWNSPEGQDRKEYLAQRMSK